MKKILPFLLLIFLGKTIIGQSESTNAEDNAFITTWKTDNPGTSEDNQIIIPTVSSLEYNYSVDWGDGTSSTGVTGNAMHSYVNPGTYAISIYGIFPAIILANSGEEEKLLEVNQWGDISWQAFLGSFFNCKNLDITATDIPNLSQVEAFGSTFTGCESLIWNSSVNDWDISNATSLFNLFNGAKLFNQDISSWDVSGVTSFNGMFGNAALFNQDLSAWDVSNAERMNRLFNNSGLSNENYDKTLLGWAELPSLQNDVQLDAPQNQYCLSETARQNIIDTYGWTINDAGLFCEDTTAPELTLLGDNPLIIIEGDQYVDPGATAEDETDGDITASIVIGGDIVDENIPNTYLVTYNVMDVAGNPAEEKVRRVIVEPAQNNELSVTGFSLVDAENDVILFPITEGIVIDASTLPTSSLNIVAHATDDTESVRLELSGAKSAKRTENVAPYALFGDSGSNYKGGSFDLGAYVISATPYSDNGLKGDEGTSMSIAFSFQEDLVCSNFSAIVNDFEGPTSCEGNDGYMDIGVYGATLPVSYELAGVSGPQSSNLFDGLSAGEYTIMVTDANSCSATLVVLLEDPERPNVDLGPFSLLLDTDGAYELTGGTPLGGVYSGEGVSDGFFDPTSVGAGTYEITYTFTDAATGCGNSAVQNIMVAPSSTNTITGFVLVNADTEMDIMTLVDGLSINMDDLPTTNLNIRAEGTGDVESTLLQITGGLTGTRRENAPPYAFFGDNNGNYFGRDFVTGDYTITATPYTGNNLSGEMGNTNTIGFSITSPGETLAFGTMKISPNPASLEARATFETPDGSIEQIMVFDMLGRLVQEYDAKQIKDGESYVLDVDEISAGTYFIRTSDASGNQYQKQIVIKR